MTGERPANSSMDVDAGAGKVDRYGAGTVDNYAGSQFAMWAEAMFQEPCVDMEFNSEDAAKDFYEAYSRRAGFVVRVEQGRCSEADQSVGSRRFSCNRHGYYIPPKEYLEASRRQHTSSREGCNAMMMVKLKSSGKWVVTAFVKEHTHQLAVPDPRSLYPLDTKERKIQALALELKRQKQLYDLYRQEFITFLECLEDQPETIPINIRRIVHHLRDYEVEQIQL